MSDTVPKEAGVLLVKTSADAEPVPLVIGTSADGTPQYLAISTPSPRIRRINVSDFRGFPVGEPYRFDLGDTGKNLLLHGENGAGKSSLYHGLRLLLSPRKPPQTFGDFHHVFSKPDPTYPGVVAIDLTAGTPSDYRWDAGNPHPSENERDMPFREIARRATFLDYKALLRTGFVHEDKDHINLFDLLMGTLLRDVEFPDGKTVGEHWEAVQKHSSRVWKRLERAKSINRFAKSFRDNLDGILNAPKVGIVAKANEYLAELSSALVPGMASGKQVLAISLKVDELKVKSSPRVPIRPPNSFDGADVTLEATYGGQPIPHPAIFLNEARLTAIALAIHLATAVKTSPAAKTANVPRVLVLDDALIGLDLAHRLPLLNLLQGDDFKDWQIFLLTYDANWFDMADDHLPKDSWARLRLFAKMHDAGWEMPVLEADAPYLDRAWNYIQSGDFKSAGVYLRTAWECAMREFCEARQQLKFSLKREMREYKAEDFWPLVKGHEFKKMSLDDAWTITQAWYVLDPQKK